MMHDSSIVRDTNNLFAMDQSAARPCATAAEARRHAGRSRDAQRDELEHHLHCQCGCTLDVFTCRTTDFSCQVSPAMHRDVIELVRAATARRRSSTRSSATYGERALMAPNKSGFNLVAGSRRGSPCSPAASAVVHVDAALGGNAARRRRSRAARPHCGRVDATPDEMARLDAAIKGEDRE